MRCESVLRSEKVLRCANVLRYKNVFKCDNEYWEVTYFDMRKCDDTWDIALMRYGS